MLRRRIIYCISLIMSLIVFFAANNRLSLIVLVMLVLGELISVGLLFAGKNLNLKVKVVTSRTGSLKQAANVIISTSGLNAFSYGTIKVTLQYENVLYGDVLEKPSS